MRTRLVTLLLAVIAALLAIPGTAAADAQGGESVWGQIRNPDSDDEGVEGIDIAVSQEGEEIGSATTDADGNWEVEVPEPGTYQVVLDEETVPEEFDLLQVPAGAERDVEVRADQRFAVVYRLVPQGEGDVAASPSESAESDSEDSGGSGGEDSAGSGAEAGEGVVESPGVAAGPGLVNQVVGLTVAGLLFGLIIAISSVGLSLIFGTTRLINFAHGDMVTFGAVMAMIFSGTSLLTGVHEPFADVPVLGLVTNPLIVGAALAVVCGAAVGGVLEVFLWRPLRRRNVAMIQMFIVTIGVALLLRHLLLVAFGANREKYVQFRIQDMITLGPIAITPRDLGIMVLSVAVLVGVASMLQFTRIGKAMRAVSDNRDLAESSGIDVNRVTVYVWMLGGGLSALGGVFLGLNQSVYWQMGFHLLLLMFAAVILGGLGTAYGAMVGGLAIGLVAQLSTLWFSAQLMNVWALLIMIVVLLVRPQGILGRRERVG
ncbi:branched-chain amino acid ABC transporter permease [Streptomonospora nanhaiensis]|uniref:Branched-chain amino acid transport system permease protein n=1 Tax=Streptomonospora nanhaiensis TaxID=1323731 RepID=A0A853BIC7_9ACTN|nr:branched-chain amino acid ABC transporter permease [Streptomonospora nanhaiensis]MBX9390931.1 branched-chain amino acid ABC transporter permease [Streptomonospora nanhaiensis]NYI94770.1 branched-chain amino acid transport system permease protein [Streptomonospora nanhaiensis]